MFAFYTKCFQFLDQPIIKSSYKTCSAFSLFGNYCLDSRICDRMNTFPFLLSTSQRGLAPRVLIPKLSCTTVCCWATANRRTGWAHNQCGSLLRGESKLVFKLGLLKFYQ